MDALLNLILAIPADSIPAVGGLWSLVLPFLLGAAQQLIREWLRNRKMANAGAAQQRAVNDAAQAVALGHAEKVTSDVAQMDDAAVVAQLAERLRLT